MKNHKKKGGMRPLIISGLPDSPYHQQILFNFKRPRERLKSVKTKTLYDWSVVEETKMADFNLNHRLFPQNQK